MAAAARKARPELLLLPPGARYLGDGRCFFAVWAPSAEKVEVRPVHPAGQTFPLEPRGQGWFATEAEAVPGSLYFYVLDSGDELPDPASRHQPRGVQGPSAVVDHAAYAWQVTDFAAPPFASLVFYELHVGCFTPEGTFAAAARRLADLAALGVSAVSLMPVAQFPGDRNWGYDGVYPYAVQDSYGGPEGLKRFVDAAHAAGLSVFLDVVYNHLGPEGNYLQRFGPYFTGRYQTPWGQALNFDGPHSDHVRNHFVENALAWFTDYRLDGLRLDAVHAILDFSARPFLLELSERVGARALELGRPCHLVAESEANDARVLRPPHQGGHGFTAQWSDDFHHALHVALTGEQEGYYMDFDGLPDLARCIERGFAQDGRYSAFRQRCHGSDASLRPAWQFVVFAQNHDQAGNRMLGERLSALVPFEALKVAAAALLLGPAVPLLFMGEEYGEPAPFLYFVSHADPDLVAAVREGRKREFAAFRWQAEPPDPQAGATFQASKLDWDLRARGRHKALLDFHAELLRLRRTVPALADVTRLDLGVCHDADQGCLVVERRHHGSRAVCLLGFGDRAAQMTFTAGGTDWAKALDSQAARFGGPGEALPRALADGQALVLPPHTAALYLREE